MLLGAFALMSSVFVACDKYDDDIQGLQQQIDALKATVASLQGEIDGGAVITDVTANSEGIVVTLSNGKSYTVKNGKDGAKGDKGEQGIQGEQGVAGADGKNGSVVTIGDNGNWFIDGVDTGKPSQGAQGEKGDKGDQGEKGDKGDQGEKGDKGDQGEKGDKGDKGDQGEQGVAGPQGPAGANGQDGKDADVIYFKPCTDKECDNYGKWEKFVNGVEDETYVGESWLPTGTITAVFNPETGELEFHNVEGAENGIVKLDTKAQLASLAIVPEYMTDGLGMPVVSSYYIEKWSSYDKEKKRNVYSFIASNEINITYRVNPTNADLNGVEFSFIDRVVKTKAQGDNTNLLTYVDHSIVDNALVVSAKANEIDYLGDDSKTADTEHNLFALKATTANGDVVSDYAKFEREELYYYLVCDWNAKKDGTFNYNYRSQEIQTPASARSTNKLLDEPIEFKDKNIDNLENYQSLEVIAEVDEAYDLQVVRNHHKEIVNKGTNWNPTAKEGVCATFVYNGSIDLDDVVTLVGFGGNGFEDIVNFGFDVTYKFSKPESFISTEDKVTNQQKYVVLNESTNVVTVDPALPTMRSAIGRTPIFKVEAYLTGTETLLADRYIILNIVEKEIDPVEEIDNPFITSDPVEYSNIVPVGPNGELSYKVDNKKYNATSVAIDWETVSDDIYEALGMSASEFAKNYKQSKVEWFQYVVNDDDEVVKAAMPAGVNGVETLTGTGAVNTETAAAYITFDPTQVELGKDTVFVKFVSENDLVYPDVTIAFEYEITHNNQFPALNADYQIENTTVDVPYANATTGKLAGFETMSLETLQSKGKLVGGTWKFQNTIREFLADYFKKLSGSTVVDKDLPGNHKAMTFELVGFVYGGKMYDAYLNPTYKVGTKTIFDVSTGMGAEMTNAQTLDYDEDIVITEALKASEASRTYVIKMTVVPESVNMDPCEKLFAVNFVRPFTVEVDEAVLKTLPAEAYYVSLDSLVTVKDLAGNVIYAKNANHPDYKIDKTTGLSNWDKLGATEYAAKYGLGSFAWNKAFTYALNPQAEIDFGGNLVIENGVIKWDNDGGDLQKDKVTNSVVTLTIPSIAVTEANGNVKVLSTANSK